MAVYVGGNELDWVRLWWNRQRRYMTFTGEKAAGSEGIGKLISLDSRSEEGTKMVCQAREEMTHGLSWLK